MLIHKSVCIWNYGWILKPAVNGAKVFNWDKVTLSRMFRCRETEKSYCYKDIASESMLMQELLTVWCT